MADLRPLFAVLVACAGCTTGLQQHLAFGRARVVPNSIDAHIGDVIGFEVEPPVSAGTRWMLECHGRTRFVDDPRQSAEEWDAASRPIRMETVVSPWDPAPGQTRSATRGWLWFGTVAHGESEALDRTLPIHRLEYRDLAPVTFSSAFAAGPAGPAPALSFAEREGRVFVTYRTPTEQGVPRAPSVDAMLVETGGKRVLYAEVKTDFGTVPREKLAYDVTLSYAATVAPPVEVVVVGWVGHGEYYGAFTVDRVVVGSAPLASTPTTPTPTPTATPTPAPTPTPAG